MIINRRIDGTATMTRLFVYKIVVLNNACIQLSMFLLFYLFIKLQLKKEEMQKKMERRAQD